MKKKRWTFFWLTGKREVLEGNKPNEALMLAGYGGGAVCGLDFYAEGDNDEWVWNKEQHTWRKKVQQ